MARPRRLPHGEARTRPHRPTPTAGAGRTRPARRRSAAPVALLVLAVMFALSVATALPAGADAARPTNFESKVLSVDPDVEDIAVRTEGGDAFMVLTVSKGSTVVVPDYSAGEQQRPYLRFGPDGTVELNERSAAASANESRYGSGDEDFDPDAEPRWRKVASNGTYAWHDHRIHLMVPDHLAVVDERGRVDLGGPSGTWQVPLIVGGTEVEVTGELVRLEPPAPWPWYAAAVAVGLVLLAFFVKLRRPPLWLAGAALLAAAVAAAAVSYREYAEAPADSGASVVPVVVTAVALLAALAALVARSSPATVRVGTAASAAVLLWWAISRADVFTSRVLPSGWGHLDRFASAFALGVGAAVAVTLVWRPGAVSGGPSARRGPGDRGLRPGGGGTSPQGRPAG